VKEAGCGYLRIARSLYASDNAAASKFTWVAMIDALRAELLPSNESATVSTASAKTVAPNQQKQWPEGCYKPGSCERHRRCGYANCPHLHRDIAAEIDAAVAKLLAERSAAALLPPPGNG